MLPIREISMPSSWEEGEIEILNDTQCEPERIAAFYEKALNPVERSSLRLDMLALEELHTEYKRSGLERERRTLVAISNGGVVGAALCNYASEGINFSFLENALEKIEIDESLDEIQQKAVFGRLVSAGRDYYRSRGRSFMVGLVPLKYAESRREMELGPQHTKQYSVLTVKRGAFEAGRHHIMSYYCDRILKNVMRAAKRKQIAGTGD
jgi:hypothetical protein